MKKSTVVLVLTSLLNVAMGATSYNLKIKTTKGYVSGVLSSDGKYVMFLGIRYAMVDPANPFGSCVDVTPFTETFKATKESEACPQSSKYGDISGGLDCLSVNVYVPVIKTGANKLPVMVYLHGGRFSFGSNTKSKYGPEFLVNNEVILVTVNYRMGPYGFMCLDIPTVPGNNGMKDQQAALRWVNENIGNFGGDPNAVTLFGNSGGSGSTEFHALNPDSSKLFSRFILQSGNSFTYWNMGIKELDMPIKLAKKLGSSVSTVAEALKVLKDISPDKVVAAGYAIQLDYRPCVEKTFSNVKTFISEKPEITLKTKNFTPKPMMIGNVFQGAINADFLTDINASISSSYTFENNKARENAVALMTKFYVGTNMSYLWGRYSYASDVLNNYGIDKTILNYINHSTLPIYQYIFNYVGTFSNHSAVGHEEELYYLFKYESGNYNPTDLSVAKTISKLWTNFAKYSNPTPTKSNDIGVTWPKVSLDTRYYLWIDTTLQVMRDTFHDRIAFWEIFESIYKHI